MCRNSKSSKFLRVDGNSGPNAAPGNFIILGGCPLWGKCALTKCIELFTAGWQTPNKQSCHVRGLAAGRFLAFQESYSRFSNSKIECSVSTSWTWTANFYHETCLNCSFLPWALEPRVTLWSFNVVAANAIFTLYLRIGVPMDPQELVILYLTLFNHHFLTYVKDIEGTSILGIHYVFNTFSHHRRIGPLQVFGLGSGERRPPSLVSARSAFFSAFSAFMGGAQDSSLSNQWGIWGLSVPAAWNLLWCLDGRWPKRLNHIHNYCTIDFKKLTCFKFKKNSPRSIVKNGAITWWYERFTMSMISWHCIILFFTSYRIISYHIVSYHIIISSYHIIILYHRVPCWVIAASNEGHFFCSVWSFCYMGRFRFINTAPISERGPRS